MLPRTIFLSGVFLLQILTLSQAVAALEAELPRVGRVSVVEGNARISYGEGAESWDAAAINFPVAAGARVFVDPSARIELRFGPSAVRLNGQAQLDVVALEERLAQFGLDEGAMNLALRDVYPDERFEIATPWATITIRAPGSYRVDADPAAESTRISVRAGEALVTSDAGENLVKSGRIVSISSAGLVEYEGTAAYDLDDFDRWSHAREAVAPETYSGNVPEEVTGYEELDQHGTWSTYSGYGSVWTPGGAYDWWAPYSYGQWAWVPSWGWTWVDQAPWAFATFRFGRWVYLDNRWWWAPGTLWPRPPLAAYVPFQPGQIIFTTSYFVHGKPAHHFVPLKPRHVVAVKRPWHRHGWRKAEGRVDRFQGGRFDRRARGTPAAATPGARVAGAAETGATTFRGNGSRPSGRPGGRGFERGSAAPVYRRARPAVPGAVPPPKDASLGRPAGSLASESAAPSPPAARSFPRGVRRGRPGAVSYPGLTGSRDSRPVSVGPGSPGTRTDARVPDRRALRYGRSRARAGGGRDSAQPPNAVIFQRHARPGIAAGGGAAPRGEARIQRGGRGGERGWQRNRRSQGVSPAIVSPRRPATGFRSGGMRR